MTALCWIIGCNSFVVFISIVWLGSKIDLTLSSIHYCHSRLETMEGIIGGILRNDDVNHKAVNDRLEDLFQELLIARSVTLRNVESPGWSWKIKK